MKSIIIPFAFIIAMFSISSCGQHSGHEKKDKQDLTAVKAIDDTSKTVVPDKLIIPGKSIGKITIGGNADSLSAILGKPDFSDAAMGSALMTWYANHDSSSYKTSVFAHHNFGSTDEKIARIRKILTTSPDFKTADGLNTGLNLAEYQKHYQLSPVSTYKAKGKKVKVYEAKGKGIAFEVDSLTGKGVGIVIHQPKDSLATYINLH
ncbi:hypothetical protein [Mucilaginibacter sp. L3T2-6]|uniref:hypothetical protein n=1 Tax=Mucilaginibacter sp. L3T2-6 TaxID=3062491 RepID=UPI0026747E49|nr:hypothetical protein [Mucilaginibacter sp. L3T2-6]MDO3643559.1 hypothetical protein [Mucilaginibacter sp. L3T2-6]MDV6216010.1 hypothetical protein [Mucilaginibacter sp. L3T2-6]